MSLRKILSAAINGPELSDGRFLAFCALIALIGGGAKAVLHRNEKTTWIDIVAAAIGSSLAGFIAGCLCLYMWGPDFYLLTMPVVGVAGWMGVVLLDFAAQIAMGKVRERFRDAP